MHRLRLATLWIQKRNESYAWSIQNHINRYSPHGHQQNLTEGGCESRFLAFLISDSQHCRLIDLFYLLLFTLNHFLSEEVLKISRTASVKTWYSLAATSPIFANFYVTIWNHIVVFQQSWMRYLTTQREGFVNLTSTSFQIQTWNCELDRFHDFRHFGSLYVSCPPLYCTNISLSFPILVFVVMHCFHIPLSVCCVALYLTNDDYSILLSDFWLALSVQMYDLRCFANDFLLHIARCHES